MAKGIDNLGKILFCGLVPGGEVFLTTIGKQPLVVPKVQNEEKIQKAIKLLTASDKFNKYGEKLLTQYPEWKKEREDGIREIRDLADNIDFHHRNTNIAQVPASIAGLVGGALTITGLALIPVTFGASLSLTIAGAVVGTGAAVTGIATAGTDIGVRINRTTKAQECVKSQVQGTQEIQNTLNNLLNWLDETIELATDEIVDLAEGIVIMNSVETLRFGATGYKTYVSALNCAIKIVPKAAKSLHLLRKGFGISAAASASSLRAVDIAGDVAVKSARVVASTATQAIGFSLSAVGMVADILVLGVTIYDLAKGSKTSSSKKLRKLADAMAEEMKQVTEIIEALNKET